MTCRNTSYSASLTSVNASMNASPSSLTSGTQARGGVVVAPVNVDGRGQVARQASVGIHIGAEQRHGGGHVLLQPADMREKQGRGGAVGVAEDVLARLQVQHALVDVHGTAG